MRRHLLPPTFGDIKKGGKQKNRWKFHWRKCNDNTSVMQLFVFVPVYMGQTKRFWKHCMTLQSGQVYVLVSIEKNVFLYFFHVQDAGGWGILHTWVMLTQRITRSMCKSWYPKSFSSLSHILERGQMLINSSRNFFCQITRLASILFFPAFF